MEKFVTHLKRSAVSDGNNEWRKEKLMKKCEENVCGVEGEFSQPIPWQKIESEGLDCDYSLLFPKEEADRLYRQLEDEVVYFTGIEGTVLIIHCKHL